MMEPRFTEIEETPEETVIYDKIDAWHMSEPGTENLELHEYLGWTIDEYAHWVTTGEIPN